MSTAIWGGLAAPAGPLAAYVAVHEGIKTLTSPPEELNVPTSATSVIGQKLSSDAIPRPVKAINAEAASRNGRWS